MLCRAARAGVSRRRGRREERSAARGAEWRTVSAERATGDGAAGSVAASARPRPADRPRRQDRARVARPTPAPRIDRRHPPPPTTPLTVFLSRPGDAPDFFRDIFSFATRSVRFHYGFEFDLSPRLLEIFLRCNLVSNAQLLISID